MRFFTSASALMAMVSAALAQTSDFDPVYTPKNNEQIAAGTTYEVTWQAPPKYSDGTVSIHLIGGATQNTQVPLADIASGIPNSQESYKWTIDSSLGDAAVYGLIIKYESNPEIFQYSMPFHITADDSNDGGEEPTDSPENPEDPNVTVTTAVGTMTVTLTSCPPEETTVQVPTSFVTSWSTTHAWNNTVPVPTNPPTNLPPVPTQPAPVPQPPVPQPPVPSVPGIPSNPIPTPVPTPTGAPTPIPTAGAARYVAGPVAIVGGIAMALLAF